MDEFTKIAPSKRRIYIQMFIGRVYLQRKLYVSWSDHYNSFKTAYYAL